MDFKASVIKIDLKHSEISDRIWPEIRVDNCITVGALKEKLYRHCGTPPGSMILYAYDPTAISRTQILLDNDNYELHMYGLTEGYVVYIKVIPSQNESKDVGVKSQYAALISNLNNSSLKTTNSSLYKHYVEQLERVEATNDESSFQHYRMSDEDYEERGQGLRSFIAQMRQKAGALPVKQDGEPASKTIQELREMFPLEARCSATSADLRGTVKFVGMVKNKPLIGVDLDEPLGTCDGSIGSVRCFTAKGEKYGAFYPYEQVKVGDYPEIDPFDIE
ncbi:hypothetical protein BgAZ_400630 [Babesia gibsoni]|uniref:CAP-Gly domain-containing protein n=1 Tax=Babesia gibsoni TaxID=33632 RepID=A0AAD8LIG9_BABGI|nr:hypothetical protein BgAZ_400630 [Babesia gibsoni]